jgi:hypothetical protein
MDEGRDYSHFSGMGSQATFDLFKKIIENTKVGQG